MSYYLPNAKRENLTVLLGAEAQELVLEKDGQDFAAKGVRFLSNGEEFVVKAAKEVIISGGSIASPQLLELSGIGDPSILEAAGIPVKISNINVGENLQDHLSTFESNPSVSSKLTMTSSGRRNLRNRPLPLYSR